MGAANGIFFRACVCVAVGVGVGGGRRGAAVDHRVVFGPIGQLLRSREQVVLADGFLEELGDVQSRVVPLQSESWLVSGFFSF